jgi:hypothetical protein
MGKKKKVRKTVGSTAEFVVFKPSCKRLPKTKCVHNFTGKTSETLIQTRQNHRKLKRKMSKETNEGKYLRYLLFIISGVGLSSLGTAATSGLFYKPDDR